MSINAVSPSTSYLGVQSVNPSSTAATCATDPSATAAGVSVEISKPGQLLSDLKALAESDPDKFKSVTADIAQKLKDAASSQSGGAADFLNKLAARFDSASQSGNASDLTPPANQAHPHGHKHGGHHAHAAGGDGSTPPTGAGGPDTIGQVVQNIISTAMNAASG